jgi:predicted phage tail protein
MTFTTRVWAGLAAVLVAAGPLAVASPAAMAAPKDTTPPTAPNNLHAVSITDQDIVLAWDRSTDTSGSVSYALFFDDNPTPFWVSGTQFDVHTNVVIGMIPGSTHTFQVRAEDSSGNASFSNQLTTSFAPGDDTPPTAPSNLHVVSNNSNGIVLAWDPSIDESDLIYFVDGAPCSPRHADSATTLLVGSLDTDPVCGISPGFTYTFSVRAQDDIGFNSPSSETISVFFNG